MSSTDPPHAATSAIRVIPQRADHPDAAALLAAYVGEIQRRLGAFDPARSVSADPEEMAPPRGAFLVVYDADAPVACGGIKTIGEATGEIKRMFVDPAARRRGHGRRLLTALEDAARTLGHRAVRLDTADPLVEATDLYVATGYRPIAPYNDNPFATRWFEKPL